METNFRPAFDALADPVRREILSLVAPAPMSVGEIAARCGASLPATSKHLRVLREAGLLTDERAPEDNRIRRYRLQGERVGDMRRWLEELERYWRGQLGEFKQHAERSRAGRR